MAAPTAFTVHESEAALGRVLDIDRELTGLKSVAMDLFPVFESVAGEEINLELDPNEALEQIGNKEGTIKVYGGHEYRESKKNDTLRPIPIYADGASLEEAMTVAENEYQDLIRGIMSDVDTAIQHAFEPNAEETARDLLLSTGLLPDADPYSKSLWTEWTHKFYQEKAERLRNIRARMYAAEVRHVQRADGTKKKPVTLKKLDIKFNKKIVEAHTDVRQHVKVAKAKLRKSRNMRWLLPKQTKQRRELHERRQKRRQELEKQRKDRKARIKKREEDALEKHLKRMGGGGAGSFMERFSNLRL